MKYLSENGYSSIELNELPGAVEVGSSAGRPVVLTFDDGCRDFCDNAFPILEKYGFKATVFLATGLMGIKRSVLIRKEIMGWSDAKQLQKQGIVFGSHTVNHLKLEKLSLEEVEVEIGESKNEIEGHLGKSVDYFSYPYAFPEGKVDYLNKYFMMLNKFGYKIGVTTVIGRVHRSDNILALKRIPVNNYDDPALFKAKLDGNYDWVHVPQYLRKIMF